VRRTGLPGKMFRKELYSGWVEPKFKGPEQPSKLDAYPVRYSHPPQTHLTVTIGLTLAENGWRALFALTWNHDAVRSRMVISDDPHHGRHLHALGSLRVKGPAIGS
jgi:hypothetical protein